MKSLVVTLVVAFLLAASAVRAQKGAPFSFKSVRTIDPPNSTFTEVRAIADNGTMAGTYALGNFPNAVFHGFTTADGRKFRTFDVAGSILTVIGGINTRGDVSGQFIDQAQVTHGFVATRKGVTVINGPGAVFTAANSLNSIDDSVGKWAQADLVAHGFLNLGSSVARAKGVSQDKPENNSTSSFMSFDFPSATTRITEAVGINNPFPGNPDGTCVGSFTDAAGSHGFLGNSVTGFSPIDIAPNSRSSCCIPLQTRCCTTTLGIANQLPGEATFKIVGIFGGDDGLDHGFLLLTGTSKVFKKVTPGFHFIDVPGASFTDAWALNNAGTIVGSFGDPNTGIVHGFAGR